MPKVKIPRPDRRRAEPMAAPPQNTAFEKKMARRMMDMAAGQVLDEEIDEIAHRDLQLDSSDHHVPEELENFGVDLGTDHAQIDDYLATPEWSARFVRTLAEKVARGVADEQAPASEGTAEETDEDRAVREDALEVRRACARLAEFLAYYKSGKVPVFARYIPRLKNWEKVLNLTLPENWSPQATLVMTTSFASAMSDSRILHFYKLVLLPAVRRNIAKNKKLSPHLYAALKKAVYRPLGFVMGIIVPLSEEGATLRETAIIGSVVVKMSIKMECAAACLVTLCRQEVWFAPTSYFITCLLSKKYNLPLEAVQEAADHFVRFQYDTRELPVLWHQSLLLLVQRYGAEISDARKEGLKVLARKHHHKGITPLVKQLL